MPNKRAKNQKLVTVPASDEFIARMNEAVVASGYSDRSRFIRDAVIEKMKGMGIDVDSNLAAANVRFGKSK